jgi:hypothetical protein
VRDFGATALIVFLWVVGLVLVGATIAEIVRLAR